MVDRCAFPSKCQDILVHSGWRVGADTFVHDAGAGTCDLREGGDIDCAGFGGPADPEYGRWCVDGTGTTWMVDRATTVTMETLGGDEGGGMT